MSGKRGLGVLGWLSLSVAVPVVGFFVVYRLFSVPSGSMEPAIEAGDRIAVQVAFTAKPGRGRVVAFRYPPEPSQTHLKRVIAVGGDRVRIQDKQVYLNGAAVSEPYVTHKTDYVDSYRDNFPSEPNASVYPPALDMLREHVQDGAVVVPSGKLFVLGDNRDQSLDSRYWGFVDESAVIGQPVFIYYSQALPAEGSKIRFERMFKRVR